MAIGIFWTKSPTFNPPIVNTIYWESFTEENIREFQGFWNDRECFLATIFHLSFTLIKNVHGQ